MSWELIITAVVSVLGGAGVQYLFNFIITWYKEKRTTDLAADAQTFQFQKEIIKDLQADIDKLEKNHKMLQDDYFEVRHQLVLAQARITILEDTISKYKNERGVPLEPPKIN